MLLTLSKPAKSEFHEFKSPHDYSPHLPSSIARYSPKVNGGSFQSLPVSEPSTMTGHHRGLGLPPPAAMNLLNPDRGPPPPSLSQPMDLPPRPAQWQGQESAMRDWLLAKSEEDKRKQEEEKTRQEGLRLEQRKIEQSMLRESIQGGIPLHLVPMIFAGIGGGNLSNVSLEWLHQYVAQLQAAQQQQQAIAQAQVSPELRRETRLIGQPQSSAYAVAPQAPSTVLPATSVLQAQPPGGQPPHAGAFSTTFPAGSLSPTRGRAGTAPGPTSAPRAPQSALPKLTTNEMQIHPPPTAQMQQTQQVEQPSSSPSIYFHHWVPPTSQAGSGSNPPATPSEYASSPKKRKAQGSHQAAPAPGSQYTSPSFSHATSSSSTPGGRRGHARTRSDASTRGYETHGRTASRRSTISSSEQPESGAPADLPSTGSEQRHQQPHGGNDGSGQAAALGAQVPATTATPYQAETRQTAHSQHLAGPERGPAPPGSPKREGQGGAPLQ